MFCCHNSHIYSLLKKLHENHSFVAVLMHFLIVQSLFYCFLWHIQFAVLNARFLMSVKYFFIEYCYDRVPGACCIIFHVICFLLWRTIFHSYLCLTVCVSFISNVSVQHIIGTF